MSEPSEYEDTRLNAMSSAPKVEIDYEKLSAAVEAAVRRAMAPAPEVARDAAAAEHLTVVLTKLRELGALIDQCERTAGGVLAGTKFSSYTVDVWKRNSSYSVHEWAAFLAKVLDQPPP